MCTGVAVTQPRQSARVRLLLASQPQAAPLLDRTINLSPTAPLAEEVEVPSGTVAADLVLEVTDGASGLRLIRYQPKKRVPEEVRGLLDWS